MGRSLGNTANRVEAGAKLESMEMAAAPKGKKATYAAEKKEAKKVQNIYLYLFIYICMCI